MIHEIAPHVLDNHYDPARRPSPGDTALYFRGRDVLARREGDQISFPTVGDFPEERSYIYLFRVDDTDLYLIPDGEIRIPEGHGFVPASSLWQEDLGPRHRAFAALTAFQLRNWYFDNRWCGRCGAGTVLDGAERAVRCPKCGRLIFPRVVPAVIAAVLDGDRILVVKYAHSDMPALIAGFTEIGEDLEGTVAREVMEETGVRVKDIRYFASQPWGVADDLMVGFFCDLDGDPTVKVDTSELKEAVWVRREDLPTGLPDAPLTYHMIRTFAAGREPRS